MHYNSVPFEARALGSQRDVEEGVHRGGHDTELLPASYRNDDDDVATPDTTTKFLGTELLVPRLNKIHPWLWLAGRPMPPRPLHHQLFLSRNIIITEKTDMHLVWSKHRIFLKPIPRFLLDPDFWTHHLLCSSASKEMLEGSDDDYAYACVKRHELVACGLGLLFSYAALVSHESDFHIAQREYLIPEDASWLAWKCLVRQLLEQHSYHAVNKRYWYGELRLSRIDKIYRLTQPQCLLRGYSSSYYHYSDFFNDNVGPIASFTVYVAVVLAAMQVGLSTDRLSSSSVFQDVSWGFTVFAIIAPPAAFLAVFLVFVVAFASSWSHTRYYENKRYRHMGVLHKM